MDKYISLKKPLFNDWYLEYQDRLKDIYIELKNIAKKNECRLMNNCPYNKFCIFAYQMSF